MLSNKDKQEYEIQLSRLRDAYTELLAVFHATKHNAVSRSVHTAMFEVNRAIKDLEEALEFL